MTNTTANPVIFGAFEHVSFPDLNIDDVVAKVDTGADSGAVHCASIELITRRSDGKTVLRYVPMHNHNKAIETEDFIKANVRGSTGHRLPRFIIETNIVIKGEKYKIRIGLSDRTDMKTDVLIGRRFLSENNILVDVRINQDLKNNEGGTR
jgi:hypothetical protein